MVVDGAKLLRNYSDRRLTASVKCTSFALLFVISLLCFEAHAQQRKIPPSRPKPTPVIPAFPPTPTPTPFTNSAFDPAADTLPPGFRGINPSILWRALRPRAAELQKDEFETTETHRQRVAALKDKPLFGDVALNSLLAIPIDLESVKYDADAGKMATEIHFSSFIFVKSLREAEAAGVPGGADFLVLSCSVLRALGDPQDSIDPIIRKHVTQPKATFSIPMDIPTARQSKESLRGLLVFRLIPPYVTDAVSGDSTTPGRRSGIDAIGCEVTELWVYDSATGRVLAKRKPINDRQSSTPAEDPATDSAQSDQNNSQTLSPRDGSPIEVGDLAGRAMQSVAPTYPQTARAARVSGRVTVFLLVDERGNVEAIRRTEGPDLLRRAAEDAARRWKFRPTEINGQPARVTGSIQFNFTL